MMVYALVLWLAEADTHPKDGCRGVIDRAQDGEPIAVDIDDADARRQWLAAVEAECIEIEGKRS